MNNIGYNIRRIRELKNLKPKYVAEASGIPLRTLQRIEAGESPITEQRMQHISTVLKTTPDAIRTFDEQGVSITTLNAKRDGVAIYNTPAKDSMTDPRDALIQSQQAQIRLLEEKVERLEKSIGHLGGK